MAWALTTDKITRLQLEITNYCNAGCPGCARVKYLDKNWVATQKENSQDLPDINSTHLNIEQIEKIVKNDNWSNLQHVHLCGNVDEPTIHPNFFEIIDILTKNLKELSSINIATNGGTRDAEWWTKLGNLSSELKNNNINLNVVWGIDGLEDTNHIYRKGVKWNHLNGNYNAYNRAGGHSTWQFIVFEHNKHQLEVIKENYKNWGFNQIKIIYSNRKIQPFFDEKETKKKYTQQKDNSKIKNASISQEDTQKITKNDGIFCKALDNNSTLKKSIYVTAHGYVLPCCWMGTVPSLKDNDRISNGKYEIKNHSIYSHPSMSSVLNDVFFDSLQNSWNNSAHSTCKIKCQSLNNEGVKKVEWIDQ